jgi:hypothetical protein
MISQYLSIPIRRKKKVSMNKFFQSFFFEEIVNEKKNNFLVLNRKDKHQL